jgi:hypothetical protein
LLFDEERVGGAGAGERWESTDEVDIERRKRLAMSLKHQREDENSERNKATFRTSL